MTITLGIISIKGGVGKTTISASLATDLANKFGKKVLLIDANYSAPNLGLHMDIVEPLNTIQEVLAKKIKIQNAIHSRFNVDVIPGSYMSDFDFDPLKLRQEIKKIKDNYDFVIIDSSPSLNIEILSSIFASDNIFIVTTSDYPTLSCCIKIANFAKECNKTISGLIINKSQKTSHQFTLNEIEEAVEIPVVAKIPYDKQTINSNFLRVPMPLYNKRSKFSKEISGLSSALTNSKETHSIFRKLFLAPKAEQINRQILKNKLYSEFNQ